MVSERPTLSELDERRRRLGMSRAVLAKRSGVSQPTVTRILTGREPNPRWRSLLAIVEALGVSLVISQATPVDECRKQRARDKARRLVGMVQGTMGLESQALDQESLHLMIDRVYHQLLAGSPRNLWEDCQWRSGRGFPERRRLIQPG